LNRKRKINSFISSFIFLFILCVFLLFSNLLCFELVLTYFLILLLGFLEMLEDFSSLDTVLDHLKDLVPTNLVKKVVQFLKRMDRYFYKRILNDLILMDIFFLIPQEFLMLLCLMIFLLIVSILRIKRLLNTRCAACCELT
jgi:hypothetical protein